MVATPLSVEAGLKLPQEFAGVQFQNTPFSAASLDTVAVIGDDIPKATVAGAAGLNATIMAGGGGGGGGADVVLPQPLTTTATALRTRGAFQFMAKFLSPSPQGSRSSSFTGEKYFQCCLKLRESRRSTALG